MSMDRNNNRGVVWRVAGSNLLGNKLYSFFTVLTIILAVSLISGLAMVQKSTEREKQQILNSMQHVMYMDVTDEQMKGLAEDALTEIMVPYKEGREVKEEGVKMYPFYILRQRETCRSRKMKSLWTDSFLRLWEKNKKQGQNWKFLLQKGKGKPLWSAAYWIGTVR